MRQLLLLSSLLLAACNNGDALTDLNQDLPMNPIAEAKEKLTFTCVHETIPQPSAGADVLFQYARWLQKNNQLKQDETVDAEIERLYRIAAENGHYKANINLQNGTMANVPPEKPSEALIQQLAKAKLLEPTTGRPTPASPAAVKPRFLPPDIITVNEQNIEWRLLG